MEHTVRLRDKIGSYAVLCCMLPLVPFVECYLLISHKLTQRKRKKPQTGVQRYERQGCVIRKIDTPEPPIRSLPGQRTRALSDLRYHPQFQSLLMSRLPQELRLLIWAHVLGNEDYDDILHLDLGNGIVKCRRCVEQKPCKNMSSLHHCWKAVPWTREEYEGWWTGAQSQASKDWKPPEMTALLHTCKAIYRESVDVLYSANIFDIRRTETILRLPLVILPQRFQSLRHIRFNTIFERSSLNSADVESAKLVLDAWSYELPEHGTQWPETCRILASLKNLQFAQFILAFFASNTQIFLLDDAEILYILQPLNTIRATSFMVTFVADVPGKLKEQLLPMAFELECQTPDTFQQQV